jgi:hypothetical protein
MSEVPRETGHSEGSTFSGGPSEALGAAGASINSISPSGVWIAKSGPK